MEQKQLNIRLLLIAAPVFMAMLVLSKVQKRPVVVDSFQKDSGYRLVMGTFARILVTAPDRATGQAAISGGFKKMELVDGLMSTYRPDSEISIVNKEAHERPVPVSPETYYVLEKAIEFSRLSQGHFDITIAPQIALWKHAADTNTPPTPAEKAAAKAKVGWQKLKLDPNEKTVRFTVEGMKLDLGGIAKGYGIDLALEAVRDAGALGAMIDIGGDIRCFGQAVEGRQHWRIGLQDPRVDPNDNREKLVKVLQFNDRAIATSGHYRRFVLIGGQKVSHILDPQTGQSSKKLTSTTIIAPDALTADALATAVSVLGQEKGLELIESIPEVEAIVIPPVGESMDLIPTAGAQAYIADK